MEFVLARDPKHHDEIPFQFGFKDVTVNLVTAQYLTVDFQQRLNTNITVEGFVSSDLVNWVPLVNQYTVPIDNGNDIQSVFYRDISDSTLFPKRFIKLTITEE